MTAAAGVLLTAALSIWLGIPAYLAGCWVRDLLDTRADLAARVAQQRLADVEWMAVLAATEDSPIYDRMVCESIERQEWTP